MNNEDRLSDALNNLVPGRSLMETAASRSIPRFTQELKLSGITYRTRVFLKLKEIGL